MRSVSTPELLDAWEKAATESPVDRALTLLSVACPDTSSETLTRFSIGKRDSMLLALRERTFGSRMASLVNCPACGDLLELDLDAGELASGAVDEEERSLTLEMQGLRVIFRLPDSSDFKAVDGRNDATQVQQLLLKRCIEEAKLGGQPVPFDALPEEVVDSIAEKMQEADGQANLQLNLTCPYCHNEWRQRFDIDWYFWREINAWAVQVLRDVHLLARTYGWAEADILNMSPVRREAYLHLIRG